MIEIHYKMLIGEYDMQSICCLFTHKIIQLSTVCVSVVVWILNLTNPCYLMCMYLTNDIEGSKNKNPITFPLIDKKCWRKTFNYVMCFLNQLFFSILFCIFRNLSIKSTAAQKNLKTFPTFACNCWNWV